MIKKILLANLLVATFVLGGVRIPTVSAETGSSLKLSEAVKMAREKRGGPDREKVGAVLKVLEAHRDLRVEREGRDRGVCGRTLSDEIRNVNAERNTLLKDLRARFERGEDVKTLIADVKKIREDRDGHDGEYRAAFIKCHLDQARQMIRKAEDRATAIGAKLDELRPATLDDLKAKLNTAKASIEQANVKVREIEAVLNAGGLTKEKVDSVKGMFASIKDSLQSAYRQFKAIAEAVKNR